MTNSAFSVIGAGPTGTVLQVQQTVSTAQFSINSGTYVNLSGVSVTITPKFANSQIMITVTGYGGLTNGSAPIGLFQILRNSTPVGNGVAVGSQIAASAVVLEPYYSNGCASIVANYIDSPATISAITYQLQALVTGGGILYVGCATTLDTSSNHGAYPTTITVTEINNQGGNQATLLASYVTMDTTSGAAAVNNGSSNVSSLTYNSAGNVTITFTNPFSTAFYPGTFGNGKGANAYGGSVFYVVAPTTSNPTTTAYTVQAVGSTGGATESPFLQAHFAQ
jgi:hypothetical protein